MSLSAVVQPVRIVSLRATAVAALRRGSKPTRVRAATREKIAATITDALAWQAERLSDLYASFAGEPKPAAAPSADEQAAEASAEAAPPAAEKAPRRPAKRLPKLPE